MNLHRIVLAVAGITRVIGLVLVLLPDGDAGWFAYAPESEAGDAVGVTFATFAGATLVTDRDLYGYVLIAVAAIIGSGLFGYRLGSHRVS